MLHDSVQLPFLRENFTPFLAHLHSLDCFERVQDRRHTLHFIAVGAAIFLGVQSDDLSNLISPEMGQIFFDQCQIV